MSSVTPTRRRRATRAGSRSALVGAVLAVAVATGAAGCSGDDDDQTTDPAPGPGSAATDTAPVTTETTLRNIGKDVSDAARARIKEGVDAAVDPWFDGAFLGAFPRSDFAAAFATFTEGAAGDAQQRDLALLSNQAISDQIETATATKRRITAQVFSHGGHARGATAYFTLDFDTTGALAQARRVTGRLYLTKDDGAWKVFGYDVDEAVTR